MEPVIQPVDRQLIRKELTKEKFIKKLIFGKFV